jgi:hypothetical protein
MSDGFLSKIYNSEQSVLTSTDIALLTGANNPDNLKRKLSYYVKTGDLLRLRRGIFGKNKDYDRKELATRIYTPAYVGFETVLALEGVIFQFYDSVFTASYLSRNLLINGDKFVYRKLKNEILVNQKGIINKGAYFQASKERAFLDMVYLFGDYYFDNLRGIDWDACFDMVSLYGRKNFEGKIKEYYQKYYVE